MAEQDSTTSRSLVVWSAGRRALGKHPEFGAWVSRLSPIRLPVSSEDPFFYLARAICYQQLAGNAAATIHGRFVDVLGGRVTPRRVLAQPEEAFRAAGLSRAKLAAIRDLAEKVLANVVRLDRLDDRSDDEVVEHLTQVRGIGPWTAQMFLMFHLRRPDVWPVGDLGVRVGFAKVYGLAQPPTAKELDPLGDELRPWRSPAAYYCWRVLELEDHE